MQFTTLLVGFHCRSCCLLWCKDTNFNAIHNDVLHRLEQMRAVYYGAKILILMQFTTYKELSKCNYELFIMVQRY